MPLRRPVAFLCISGDAGVLGLQQYDTSETDEFGRKDRQGRPFWNESSSNEYYLLGEVLLRASSASALVEE